MQLVTSTIENIENRIWNSIKNEKKIGLLEGLSGIALFYFNLFEVYKNKKYLVRLFEVIERINKLISEHVFLPTLYSGLAGYGWMLQNLNKNTIDISDVYLETLDTTLEKALISFSDKNEYDFLHGATGVAMYFIERLKADKNNKNALRVLTAFSKNMLYKFINNFDDVITSKQENEKKKKIIYFGLAHGISSYINFLFYLNQHIKLLEPDIKKVVIKLITFLRSQKLYNTVSKQYYPSYIDNKENTGNSRLGWCQGDLGIGLSLFNAATLLNDSIIKQEAIELITSTEKISFKVSNILDFGFCHGSTGLIIQYYLAQEKCSLNTKETQKKWFEELKKQTDNFTTFKTFSNPDFIDNSDLIQGASGLGLALLTLDGKIKSDWLRCFNLY